MCVRDFVCVCCECVQMCVRDFVCVLGSMGLYVGLYDSFIRRRIRLLYTYATPLYVGVYDSFIRMRLLYT